MLLGILIGAGAVLLVVGLAIVNFALGMWHRS